MWHRLKNFEFSYYPFPCQVVILWLMAIWSQCKHSLRQKPYTEGSRKWENRTVNKEVCRVICTVFGTQITRNNGKKYLFLYEWMRTSLAIPIHTDSKLFLLKVEYNKCVCFFQSGRSPDRQVTAIILVSLTTLRIQYPASWFCLHVMTNLTWKLGMDLSNETCPKAGSAKRFSTLVCK